MRKNSYLLWKDSDMADGLDSGCRLGYQIRCEEFLNASRWYFVGPPPAEGGRRPHAEAAASPQGWPPPKTSLFLIANGREAPLLVEMKGKGRKANQGGLLVLLKGRHERQGFGAVEKGTSFGGGDESALGVPARMASSPERRAALGARHRAV
jgi:hypothetical protein